MQMNTMDEQLFNFLQENIDQITDEWLARRDNMEGTIYSSKVGEEVENILRQQNQLTNLTIASSLLDDKSIFEENKRKWAIVVAESRVSSNTPVFEVLQALMELRKTIWSFVERFVALHNDEIERPDIIKWGIHIHSALDELKVQFSKMYDEIMNNRLKAQQSLIEELYAPVIQLNESIGVLPLIGDIDSTRVQSVIDVVPQKCTDLGVEHLYIDLSGVSIMDTMVANYIYQLTQILDLLGIESTITGIRPEIAQTSVQLGLDFSRVQTFGSLQLALKTQFNSSIENIEV